MFAHQMEDSSALTMLEEVTTVESRQDVAMTLVKIYLGQGLVVPFLDYLNTREVNQTSKIDEKSFVAICLSKVFVHHHLEVEKVELGQLDLF